MATIPARRLVGVVDALAALNAQRERERVVGRCGKQFVAIVRHWRRIDGCGDSLDVVASRSCVIYRMIKDPQAIRDFARTLLRSPASFPTISPDR